jgi:NAD(P)-dependent dehydrogenase (short-subunit alcohol dehydrogenase family)
MMSQVPQGKVALVAGATRGAGRGIEQKMGSENFFP